jgi:hypothetical protein
VQQADPDLTDLDDVAAHMADQAGSSDTRRALEPFDLVLVDVDRYLGKLQEIGDPGDLVAEQVAADVVGVVVGREHPA